MKIIKLTGHNGVVYVFAASVNAISATDSQCAPPDGSMLWLKGGGPLCLCVKEKPEEVLSAIKAAFAGTE